MGKIIFLGIIIFILVVGVIVATSGCGKTETTTTTASNPQTQNNRQAEPTQPAPEAMKVVTADFIAAFDKNQLSAEEKYKGKLIEFTAKVQNISEVMGSPFLSLEPETPEESYFGTTIQCFFKDKSQLLSLANGQKVTVQGTVDTESFGVIGVEDCQVVQ
jgi:hypothetical protein